MHLLQHRLIVIPKRQAMIGQGQKSIVHSKMGNVVRERGNQRRIQLKLGDVAFKCRVVEQEQQAVRNIAGMSCVMERIRLVLALERTVEFLHLLLIDP
jgi:hypothetical protein